jgi:hypothetical protein
MSAESSMLKFLLYLNANHEVRRKVEELERSLGTAFREKAKSIAAIAKEAGFDVSGWDTRPGTPVAGAIEPFACCGFATFGTEAVEKELGS